MGVAFEVMPTDVNEVHLPGDPSGMVCENARLKYEACNTRLAAAGGEQDVARYVLTADTIVSFEGHCIEKPFSMEQARDFLRSFSGKHQTVFTGLCFGRAGTNAEPQVVESHVWFRVLSDAIIRDYLTTVDPMDKAGAYDVCERGELIIERVDGSVSNVSGLPAELVSDLFRKEGLL
jgi:septum formation protein